jgi:hypothetical protein
MPFEELFIGHYSACSQSMLSLACHNISHVQGCAVSRRLPSLNALKAFEAAARPRRSLESLQRVERWQSA